MKLIRDIKEKEINAKNGELSALKTSSLSFDICDDELEQSTETSHCQHHGADPIVGRRRNMRQTTGRVRLRNLPSRLEPIYTSNSLR
jgi:hypothetical protein